MEITSKKGEWTDAALKVLKERYLLRDPQGNVVETPEEMLLRVARAIAAAERRWHDEAEVQAVAERFYEMMVEHRFLPNSPTLMNAGTGNGLQYSACFVLPVPDSLDGIFQALKEAALIHQSGGGVGYAFTRLRPQGSFVRRSTGVASGPISFMRIFDQATETIKQGGKRRGANMGVLRVDHPDIEAFITCKLDGGITNFNISVGITDEFMEALKKGEKYPLRAQPGWPRPDGGRYEGGEILGWKDAREVWAKIVDAAWRTGDPGLLFLDRANRSPSNPIPKLEQIEATNPCVTGDTFVMTAEGPRQVRELLGRPVTLVVHGRPYRSTEEGFFSTGVRPVFRLETREGFSVRLTADHPVRRVVGMGRQTLEAEWVPAGELRPGDRILLNDHRTLREWPGPYGEAEGYLIGLLVGDGTLKEKEAVLSVWVPPAAVGAEGSPFPHPILETALAYARRLPHRADFRGWVALPERGEVRLTLTSLGRLARELGLEPGRKEVTPTMEKASSAFYRGFLRGLFDAEGSVQGSHEEGISVRLAQSNLELLRGVQRMLLRLGIFSRIYRNRRPAGEKPLPDGRGGRKLYRVRAQHELVISRESLRTFAERVGFTDPEKARRLQAALRGCRRALNRERFVATVEALIPDGEEEVFDVQVPGIHAFDANGLVVHNCGEQFLGPYDACNLGSINLNRFLVHGLAGSWGRDPEEAIDWGKLEETVRLAVRFLDDVIDVNPFPLEAIREKVLQNRRIGLGVMGWADLLFALGIPYDSQEALDLAARLMQFIHDVAEDASIQLAEVRGPFPNWPHSIYADGRPRRNAALTTIAPTGSISILAGCSSGIEPVFALAYRHQVRQPDGSTRVLTLVNQVFLKIAEALGVYSEELVEHVIATGSLHDAPGVPEEVQRVFVTAHEIAPEWHVRMQAAFQTHGIDNAVSKTVNLPNQATREEIGRIYELAYDLGCKGITVYRDGSKSEQVLYAGTRKEEDKEAQTPKEVAHVKPRPHVLRGATYRMPTPLGTAFITVNENGEGPFEVFLNVGKAGSDTSALAEAIGRLISLILRLPSPMGARERLRQVIGQLAGIGGRRPLGFGPNQVLSLPDAIARALAEHLGLEALPEDGPADNGAQLPPRLKGADLCPECGQATLVLEEGCKKCYSCGYSEC